MRRNTPPSITEPVVNYIWLCARESNKDSDDSVTRLPLHYFERMYKNAAKYPDAKFNLWLDFKQLDSGDRFFLDSHRYLFNAGNINVRNLRDIPEYATSPGFDLDSNIALYAKADFSRVLVLNHLLRGNHSYPIIYSDLDCEDVKIEDPEVQRVLSEFGMVFGVSGKNKSANGYIALQGDQGRFFMNDYLLPRTIAAFQKNLVNHFGAFVKAINNFRRVNHLNLARSHWGRVALPKMRTAMPYNEDMYGGVCAPRGTRVPMSVDLV